MVIAATRMYRSLQYYVFPTNKYDILPINSSPSSLLSVILADQKQVIPKGLRIAAWRRELRIPQAPS